MNILSYFASDADYVCFFIMSVYGQHHLRSSIKFAKYKIKPCILTARTVKSNFKGKIERSFSSDNAFSFMSCMNY